MSIDYFNHLFDSNYRVDLITKTVPTVLRELKLQGLHYYLRNEAKLVQGVVAFIDKVMTYVPHDFEGREPVAPQIIIRALFSSCPEGGHVSFA